jgi:DmsE family decaheme c-type cytochrome
MSGRALPVLGLLGAVTVALLVFGLLALPSRIPAQQPVPPPPAPAPAAELPAGYAGAETCKGCHEDAWHRFSHTKMGRLFLKQPRNMLERLACENCHGPGRAHAEAGGGKGVGGMITFAKNDPTPMEKRNQICLACHTKGTRVFWKGSPHELRDVPCTSCHRVMEDRSPRAQLAKPTEIETCGTCHQQKRAAQLRASHMPLREGKMSCSSCHNPHGTVTPALLTENSPNDNCFRCHTEKRGPFLWQHAPVIESCANCHDPHGSNHEAMLKVAKPRLCQQCHIESRHPTNPYGRDTGSLKFVMGSSCLNCHVNIHGSNHPSGFAFTR